MRKYVMSRRGGVEVEFKKDTEKLAAKKKCCEYLRKWASYFLSDNFQGIERTKSEIHTAQWIMNATDAQLLKTCEIVIEA